jgi:hypothetical protein
MVSGYSATSDLFYLTDRAQQIVLPPGGWSLSASDYVAIEWEQASPAHRGIYGLRINNERLHRGMWVPKLDETVTESFFFNGDLLAMNYRLLRYTPEVPSGQ